MRKKTSTSLLLGLLAASLVATPCYASATQKKITETQNAQQENQKKLSDAQGRINSLEAQKGRLEGYLKELNQQLSELGENYRTSRISLRRNRKPWTSWRWSWKPPKRKRRQTSIRI